MLQIAAQHADAGSSDQQTTKFRAEAGPGERGGEGLGCILYKSIFLTYGHLFFNKSGVSGKYGTCHRYLLIKEIN